MALHARLLEGEPLQYVLGETEFYNCTIRVGNGVLIPRPETELLVDLALNHYPGRGNVLDLCTGSGCIPLAMALERPDIPRLVGADISEDALYWANLNRDRLQISSVEFKQSDLFEGIAGETFELITANPPYIGRAERPSLPETVSQYEPELALFAEDVLISEEKIKNRIEEMNIDTSRCSSSHVGNRISCNCHINICVENMAGSVR